LVFNSLNRFFIGILLVLNILISYVLNLENLLLFIILLCTTYELYKLNLIPHPILFFFLFITLISCIFLPFGILKYLYLIELVLVFLIFLNDKYKKFFFIISVYIFFIILFNICNFERNLFYTIFLISFFNDTIAYIFGKSIGGPLIIPNISPKKTWSGTVISFLLSTIFLVYLNFNIFLAAVVSLFLFLGDIFFSYIKRYLGIKDFSLILKDHGGILDRLDSMFFVVLIFQIFIVLK
jgi:phosphatidate cytidylyltransferase